MTKKLNPRHANVARREYVRGRHDMTCSEEGCDRIVYCLGLCDPHYQKVLRARKRRKREHGKE